MNNNKINSYDSMLINYIYNNVKNNNTIKLKPVSKYKENKRKK